MYDYSGMTLDGARRDTDSIMRKVLSNPMLILIGLAFIVQFAVALVDTIDSIDYIEDNLKNTPDEHFFYSILSLSAIITQIVGTALIGIGFCLTFFNAKNTTSYSIPRSGISILYAGVIFYFLYWLSYIGAQIYYYNVVISKYANYINYNSNAEISLWITLSIAMFYISSFISFVAVLRGNITKGELSVKGSIFFAVMNLIFSLFLIIGIAAKDSPFSSLGASDTVSAVAAISEVVLMTIYGFYYRATVKNSSAAPTFYQPEPTYSNVYGNDEFDQRVAQAVNPTPANNTYAQNSFCPACGNRVVSGQAFCGVCGYRLN